MYSPAQSLDEILCLFLHRAWGPQTRPLEKGLAAVSGPTGEEVSDVGTGWGLLYHLYDQAATLHRWRKEG